jgi:hypothetical protein
MRRVPIRVNVPNFALIENNAFALTKKRTNVQAHRTAKLARNVILPLQATALRRNLRSRSKTTNNKTRGQTITIKTWMYSL